MQRVEPKFHALETLMMHMPSHRYLAISTIGMQVSMHKQFVLMLGRQAISDDDVSTF